MPSLRASVRSTINSFGFDLRKVSSELGQNAYLDLARLLERTPSPVVFDVGANFGQTIDRVVGAVQAPRIYAFEPSPNTFAGLRGHVARIPRLTVENCALGAEPGTLELLEHASPDMTSFLEVGADGWGETKTVTPVPVKTVDGYCAEHAIERIDVLKSDTQGFDLEVLKGARAMLDEGRVGFLLLEVNFDQSYRGMPRADEIFSYVFDRGFQVVSFYNFHHHANRASWADGLFIYAPTSEAP